ncbi:MAG: hypothetical protein ACR2JM_09630, partial [Mycobacterium sp.]
ILGGLFLAFSGDKHPKDTVLKPIVPSTPATTEPTTEPEASGGLDFAGGLGDSATSSSSASGADSAAGMFAAPGGSAPSPVRLPSGQLPPATGFQPPPPTDFSSVVDPYVQAQREAIAANLAGAITGPSVGAVMSGINSAAVVVGDLILYAAYTNNGGALLNQIQAALPAVALPAAGLGAPDFSGLSSAFAAAAAAPPIGIPSLPPPPAGLPTPEQVLGGLRALPPPPPIGLPQLPPPPGLPTPEQVMGGLAGLGALPAIGLPALPPPPPIGLPQLPPIGLPQLPPPPPIGLPSIGFPSIGLPSITRLLGLPF